MTASNTDNFTLVSVAGSETTMAAPGKTVGASSINLTSATGWPTTTGIIFAIRRVDSNGNYVAGTYTEWAGVLSGTTITLNTTPLYGSDQSYAADGLTQVFQPVSSSWANRIVQTILAQHTQAGAHVGMTNSGGATFTGGITTDSLTITGSNVGAGWTALGQTLTYGANNGNKEFTCTAAADLRSTLSVGMKLQLTRNTVPPTQCMAFASASSQYGSKSSPSGISFTGNWTGETWIYLLSYPSATAAIIGRDSAAGSASGFEFNVTASGQLGVLWRNGSGSTAFTTYQSLPINTWVHVATTATVATPTAAFYINGNLAAGLSSATAATSVVQASTNLQVGKGNNTTGYLNAYLSETRLWSVAQTQSAIQSNMAINCVGSESNLIALFEGNGNFTDLTSNANTLTAQGGAIATQANNPYNAIEYGFVTSISYSSPTTTLKIWAGNSCSIPNMTLNSAQYSTARTPYGFPAARGKWRLAVYGYANEAVNIGGLNTWVVSHQQIGVPSGDWTLGWTGGPEGDSTSNAIVAQFALAQTTPGKGDIDLISRHGLSTAAAYNIAPPYKQTQVSLAALTTYTFYGLLEQATGTMGYNTNISASNPTALVLFAECGYL